MKPLSKPRPAFKAWLQTDEGYVFGPGVYSLLRKVKETGTLKQSAASLGMSYRFAWGLVRKAEEKLGQQLIVAHKGGRAGGGGAELTEVGSGFVEEFARIEEVISELLGEGVLPLGVGPRSRLEGRIIEMKTDQGKAKVTLELEDHPHIRLILPWRLIEYEKLAEGNRVAVELTPLTSSVKRLGEAASR